MAAKACKCKPTECEECPEWIFTFADLVMLMMGFFVILWVLKPPAGKQNEGAAQHEWIKTVAGIREAFGYQPNPNSRDPIDMQVMIDGLSKERVAGPGKGAKTEATPEGSRGPDPDVTTIRLSQLATEGGKMIFDAGSAKLSPSSCQALDAIADIIRGHLNVVMVKGHTSLDDLPDSATGDEKLALSLKRAQAAENYLISKGVDPRILRVEGCSTFEPVEQGIYTTDSQSLNRRVEVEATATLLPDLAASPQTQSQMPATQP